MTQKSIERREFLKQACAAAAVGFALPAGRVLGANDRVRLGIIGAGARGQELMHEFVKVPNAEFVAVADVYTRRHDEAKAIAPGITQAFRDYRRLLDLKEVDAVIVATPLHCHARHFLDTIAAGKDLYSEKTMTWSIAEAETCREAAKRSNRVVGIGLQHQSSGQIADAKQWLNDGIAGKVTQVEAWMSRNSKRGHGQWIRDVPSDCVPANVDWTAFLNGRPARPFDPYKFINWRLFWEFSGGNVTENMVHQIAGVALEGQAKGVNHMANFVECVRSRKEPNSPVEIGYRSAVAAHMANLSYRQKQRVTLETAMAGAAGK